MRFPFAAPLFAGFCFTLAAAPALATPSFQSLAASVTVEAPAYALSRLATDVDPRVLQLALDARQCAADLAGDAGDCIHIGSPGSWAVERDQASAA